MHSPNAGHHVAQAPEAGPEPAPTVQMSELGVREVKPLATGTRLEGREALRPTELPQGSTPPLSLEPGISLEERHRYLNEQPQGRAHRGRSILRPSEPPLSPAEYPEIFSAYLVTDNARVQGWSPGGLQHW